MDPFTPSPYDQTILANHGGCWEDSHGVLWFDNGEPCAVAEAHPPMSAEEDAALRALVNHRS